MTRRDIIIISVLVNMGLFAVLLVTAVKSDPDISDVSIQAQQVAVADSSVIPVDHFISLENSKTDELSPSARPVDEIDYVLKEYLPDLPLEASLNVDSSFETAHDELIAINQDTNSKQYNQVIVKRGDALEKIARANKTTVDNIRKANHLTSDKLVIGQVLKIPVSTQTQQGHPSPAAQSQGNIAEGEPVYYVIKSGDNPWKIAKIYNVKFEDLLKLNHLDEDKAKNLKIGDKIRVK